MQGRLGDKLFSDLIRDLSRENATGRLTITHEGVTIEVFFESGVPIQAANTPSDQHAEPRLERDDLDCAEQVNAASLAPGESLPATDAVMIDRRAPTAGMSQQTQRDLSRRTILSAFEWYTGDYQFVAGPVAPAGAKLDWTAAECILSGARHASSSETILDVIAPGYKVVGPSTNRSGSSIQTPTLSSVEGYVLSCIQSPVAIWEAASFTGLSHTETRSAILVLVLLGLLVDQQCPPPD